MEDVPDNSRRDRFDSGHDRGTLSADSGRAQRPSHQPINHGAESRSDSPLLPLDELRDRLVDPVLHAQGECQGAAADGAVPAGGHDGVCVAHLFRRRRQSVLQHSAKLLVGPYHHDNRRVRRHVSRDEMGICHWLSCCYFWLDYDRFHCSDSGQQFYPVLHAHDVDHGARGETTTEDESIR